VFGNLIMVLPTYKRLALGALLIVAFVSMAATEEEVTGAIQYGPSYKVRQRGSKTARNCGSTLLWGWHG